ncbi:MAG: hypothetical protein HYR56_21580 [Acidobacteria bacterium]|nr:hypothetical protein [Acidobacteriota bacterium]MBI3425185.1 hypothetical protein [Acidobacteriota bacterium]
MHKQNVARLMTAVLLAFLLTSAVLAQQPQPTPTPIPVPAVNAPTEDNFNRYKSDLLTILPALRAMMVTLGNPEMVSRIDSGFQQTQAMSFATLGANYPGFPDLTQLKQAVVQQQHLLAEAYAKGVSRVVTFSPSDPFPPIKYASFCPLNPQPPEVEFSIGLTLAIAEGVREIAKDFCDQITEILGGGGNFSVACIVTEIIYFALKFADYPIKACHDDTNLVAADVLLERMRYLHDQLDYSIANDNANKAKLSTQLTNAENHIVTNDNNNKAALSSQLNSFQTLTTRMSLEANLAEDPTNYAGAGLFELPASRGGYLEVARQVLIDTYNAHLAAAGAGVTIYNPSAELSLGATLTAQGKYRDAYYYYRKAYRSVVKYP